MVSETNSRGGGEWWSRPIATYPAENDRAPTPKERAACCAPCCGGLLTFIAAFSILIHIDGSHHSHSTKFSIQSISVVNSPNFSTWQIDFLVKNPSSRYSIYYDGDDVSVKLGLQNAAVLNASSHRKPNSFSLAFVAKNDDVVSEELDIELRAKLTNYLERDEAGRFDVSCRNLTRRHDNVDKIKSYSSFTSLESLILG